MSWSPEQAKLFARRARKRVGVGWQLLGPELRRALVCDEIVSVLLGQADEDGVVRVGDIQDMIGACFRAARLEDDK